MTGGDKTQATNLPRRMDLLVINFTVRRGQASCTSSCCTDRHRHPENATPLQACKLQGKRSRSFLTERRGHWERTRVVPQGILETRCRDVDVNHHMCRMFATSPPDEPRIRSLRDSSKMPIVLFFVPLLLSENDCSCR